MLAPLVDSFYPFFPLIVCPKRGLLTEASATQPGILCISIGLSELLLSFASEEVKPPRWWKREQIVAGWEGRRRDVMALVDIIKFLCTSIAIFIFIRAP